MEGKKKYFALVLFLLLGMITYTFANPNEELEEKKTSSNFVDYSEEKEVNSLAEKIVEKVEQQPTEENITEALTVIEETVTQEVTRQNLNQRVEEAKEAIDVAALVTKVETMINDSKEKADITESKNFYITNNVEQEANNMDEGNVKENIKKRINYINEVFNDSANPEITGIENGAVTNENVKITIKDEVEYTTEVTLNNEKIEFTDEFNEEGVYVINVVDDAKNKATLTFTIDKTKPKFENLPSREAHLDSYVVDVTDATKTTITLQKDHGAFIEIEEGYNITEEATYQLVGVDAAGNKFTTWIIIDKTRPTITGVTNNSYVQKCDRAYIHDRYLTEVIIDGVKYTRKDFTHDTKNENFKFEQRICKEGKHTIIAKDRIGHVYEETFTIDKTAPEITFNGNVTGDEKNIFYLEKGANTGVVKITANLKDNIDGESKLSPYKLDFEHAHDDEQLDQENARLDSSKEGTYKYYYKATDKAGHTTEKILYVVVQDTSELKVLSNTVKYDEKTKTAIATIVTSKNLNTPPTGWTQGLSKLNVITKKFYKNTDKDGEKVKLTDLLGSEITVDVVVDVIKETREITLTEDTVLEEVFINKDNQITTYNLNGFKLTVKHTIEENKAMIQNDGVLIFKNGTIVNDTAAATMSIENSANGELTLEKVIIEDKGTKKGTSIVNNGGKLTITDSKYNSSSTSGKATINSTGELQLKNTEITNNSQKSYAVITGEGTALIENVKIISGRGGVGITGGTVVMNNNDIFVKEGKNGYHAIYITNNSDSDITVNSGKYSGHRYGINITTYEGYTGKVNTKVNGGEYEHKHTNASYSAVKVSKYQETDEVNLVITGGTFKKTNVDKYLPEGYTQNDKFTVING